MQRKVDNHLKLAAVKLQQPAVRKEQLAADDSGSQAGRAPKPLLLHQASLPGSFQHH